jgi:hypothetical protein
MNVKVRLPAELIEGAISPMNIDLLLAEQQRRRPALSAASA